MHRQNSWQTTWPIPVKASFSDGNYELKARMKEWRKTENTRGDTKEKITGETTKRGRGGMGKEMLNQKDKGTDPVHETEMQMKEGR